MLQKALIVKSFDNNVHAVLIFVNQQLALLCRNLLHRVKKLSDTSTHNSSENDELCFLCFVFLSGLNTQDMMW